MKPLLLNHAVNLHFYFSSTAQIPCDSGVNCDTGLPTVSASSGNLQLILQLLFGALGAVAIIMILIGAIQFIASGGDPQSVAKGRSTIIYSLVGLLVCISAELIVTFILTNI
jgi:hypothetical protein